MAKGSATYRQSSCQSVLDSRHHAAHRPSSWWSTVVQRGWTINIRAWYTSSVRSSQVLGNYSLASFAVFFHQVRGGASLSEWWGFGNPIVGSSRKTTAVHIPILKSILTFVPGSNDFFVFALSVFCFSLPIGAWKIIWMLRGQLGSLRRSSRGASIHPFSSHPRILCWWLVKCRVS